ncbi:hypothetical protein QRQ56_26695 [Bradyrhizobium sp. U531]
MNVDELRPALATPFPAVVLEIAYQFLLLRVDPYDRFVRRKERPGLRVDELKLRVAIDVLAAFSGLVVRLQAVADAAQKLADNSRANLMTLLRQLVTRLRRLRVVDDNGCIVLPRVTVRPDA